MGAVGKGYAAGETAAVLREYGVESALLDFGGNILTIGTKPDNSPWRVGIRDPDTEGNLGVLELAGQGVSVSGGYEKYFVGEDGERYWHILDPATGAPARSGLVQAAVVSSESKRCDYRKPDAGRRAVITVRRSDPDGRKTAQGKMGVLSSLWESNPHKGI